MTATASACGKIILLGEHAVVYGCPAVAAGIKQRAHATAARAPVSSISLDARPGVPGDSELQRAFEAVLESLDSCPVAVNVTSEVPPGLGLGASAAMAVAVARAVCRVNAREDDCTADAPLPFEQQHRVVRAAQAWEAVFHGRPSGIDVAAATIGGCFQFSTDTGPKPLELRRPLALAVGVAGPAMSTKIMVDGVAELRQRKPDLVQRSIDGIRALVQNARGCLQTGDLPALGRLLDLNQMLLAGLFLSTESIERACAIARSAGALGAKLTGKGGGGCVIALCGDAEQAILHAWRDHGIDGFATLIQPHSLPDQPGVQP